MTTATAAQLARAAAPITGRVYRVFIGPQERFIDYALYAAGEPVSIPIKAALTAPVTFGTSPVDVTVDDATGYANGPSMVCLRGRGGATWIRYASRDATTFEECTRVWGVATQPTGAAVTQWADITTEITGAPTVSRDFTDVVSDWVWQIQGKYYDSNLMAPDAAVLIVESVTPDGVPGIWTDYLVAGLGYVRRWESYGDAAKMRRWSARVESIRTYVDSYQVAGQTFGRVNLAANQPVTASPALANPLDALDEWRGAIGTTDADKLTDSGIDTGPYVSQVAPTQTVETPGSSGGADPGILFEEVYIDGTYFWFQMRLAADSPNYNTTGVSLTNFAITNKQTVFVTSGSDGWPREVRGGASNYLRLKDITVSEDADRLIITNNRQRFLREYNVSSSLPIYDSRELPGFGDDGLAGRNVVLDAAGDWLQLRYCIGLQTVRDMAAWGAVTSSDWWNGAADEDESGDQWTSAAIAVWDAAGSIRRVPVSTDTNAAADWDEESDPNPVDRRTDTDPVFAAIELADTPTALSEDITALSPAAGAALPLSEPEYLRLPTGQTTLRIRIDAEEMIIEPIGGTSNGWNVVARAYNGTSADDHAAEAVVEYYYGGEFIRYPWVESLEWRRWERFDRVVTELGTVLIARVPKVWEIWGSREPTPAEYGTGGDTWKNDWLGGRLQYTLQTESLNEFMARSVITPQPLKHMMIVIKRMAIDNTRAMLNEIRIWRAGLTNTNSTQPGIGAVVEYYLSQFPGMSRVTIDDDVFDDTSGDVPIAGGSLGQVQYDLAKSYGFIVEYTRDNKMRIRRNPFHPRAERPELFAPITPAMIAGTQNPQRATNPSRVGAGQVQVNLHDTDALRVYQGKYPPTSQFGDVRVIERTGTGGSIQKATELAQAEYLANPDISREIEFEIAGVFPELDPLQRVLVFDYTYDAADGGRWEDCVIKSVNGGGEQGERVLAQVWRQA